MYNYNPNVHYPNGMNGQQQVPVNPTVMPDISAPRESRQGATSWFGPVRGRGVKDHFIDLPGTTRHSTVFASITEMGIIDGTGVLKPFQGAAGMTVHNVVPIDNNKVSVRVQIHWDSDLWYKIFVARF